MTHRYRSYLKINQLQILKVKGDSKIVEFLDNKIFNE